MADIHSSFTPSAIGWTSQDQSVDGKFNVHMEAAAGGIVGDVSVFIKTAGSKYYKADTIRYKIDEINGGLCMEGDFSVLGSKTVKIVSSVQPTYSEVTTIG